MHIDVVNALIQLPFAALLSIVYLREAQRLNVKGTHRRRMHGLLAMGSITAGLMAWRFATLVAWTPPSLQPSGEQVTQTVLLIGLGIAYILLREQPSRSN